jgi:hypothetical protein
MQITIERGGGIAGPAFHEQIVSADTQALPPEAAAKAAERWRALKPLIVRSASRPAVGADFLKYTIVVRDESGEQRLELADDGNETVRALLEFARQLGQ